MNRSLDWHAVGYVRVSTKDQNEDTQVHQILTQGVPRERIFVDTAISGTTTASDRLEFRALLEYVCSPEHEVKTLYVFEISRIGSPFLETLDVMRGLRRSAR